jgi:periplasmic divalent cation tolerance protein
MAGMNLLLVFVTFPDAVQARQIGTILIESQLAACVNLVPSIESIYRWQGVIETSQEVLAIFKTTPAAWPAFEAKLKELHPYEVPEIVALPAGGGSEAYLAWVRASVGAETP